MKKAKRIMATLLATAMAVSLLAAMPLGASAYGGSASTASELREYLRANTDGTVIDVGGSFEYNYPLLVAIKYAADGSKSTANGITINLNGNSVTMLRGIVIYSGKLTINGPGNFTIIGNPALTVNNDNVASQFIGTNGANVTVKTRSTAKSKDGSLAVVATGGATVKFSGSAIAGGGGSKAVNVDKGIVEIYGNVSASGTKSIGVESKNDSIVRISGNVDVSGANSKGVYANDVRDDSHRGSGAYVNNNNSGIIEVGGSVKAAGSGSTGAHAKNGTVVVNGSVSGDGYDVRVDTLDRNAGEPHRTGRIYNGRSYDLFESGSSRVYIGQQSAGLEWRAEGEDYYCYKDGVMQTGWIQDGGKWYYLGADGKMVKDDWLSRGGKWYYLTGDGTMALGWTDLGSSKYYFDSKGVMKTDWLNLDGAWYYLNGNGKMAAGGSQTIGGKLYNFDATGKCLNP